ncbi:MAG: hypothetical protein IJD96_11700 [Lachnospiraceae bacterium]|nr:hypothetical protein [Lachnospiraceae bacterium]
MSAYNVRVYNYVNGQQIRIYSNVYMCEDENDVFEKKKQIEKENPTVGISGEEIWKNIEQYEEYLEVMQEDYEIENAKNRSVKNSMSRTVQKICEITRSNEWEYFITLTFNPEKVDSFNYSEVVNKLSKWLNNLKNRYSPNLRYIVVPELHKSGRFHFHGLFADIGNMTLIDSGKRLNDGTIIYNIGNYNLGFTTATKIKDNARVSSYITKYISKDLCAVTANKKRYWCSKNLNKVKIDEYILEYNEIKQMLEDLSENITFCKTTKNEYAGTCVKYVEIV